MQHIPNMLSVARILLSPYIFYLLWTRQYPVALVWFFISGLTDFLDGYLARKLQVTSAIGAQLDPIGDKILLSGAFLVLALTGELPIWLAVVVLGRDVFILLGVGFISMFLKHRTKEPPAFPPSQWGKWSTTVQILYVLAVVAGLAGWGIPILTQGLQWGTVALTAISGVDYFRRGLAIVGD